MKKLYKKQETLRKHVINNVPKDVIERSFIMTFFKDLPIESLKKLIKFKEIDFENNELWESENNYELLSRLRHDNSVLYTGELYLKD